MSKNNLLAIIAASTEALRKKPAESRNSIIVTEVCPESRSVEVYVVDANSVRASWRLIRSYREKIGALQAENERLHQAMQRLATMKSHAGGKPTDDCDGSVGSTWNPLAAPEPLEALEMCTRAMASVLPDFNPYDQAAYDKARAAIAKARGEK